MSDYLSSLVARSLRREQACEPRRPQMFEPRQETSGEPFVEVVNDGLASDETFEGVTSHTPHSTAPPVPSASAVYQDERGVLNEPRTDTSTHTFVNTRHSSTSTSDTQPTQKQTQTSQSIRTRPSEDAPTAAVQPERSAHPVVSVRESSPHLVARLAEKQTFAHEPSSLHAITPATEVSAGQLTQRLTQAPVVDTQREVTDSQRPSELLRPGVQSQRPLSHDVSLLHESESAAAQAPMSEGPPSAKASFVVPSMFDEGGGELTSTVIPRVERVESNGLTKVVDVEVNTQPRTSMLSERSTITGTETFSDVVLEPAPSAEVRPATLTKQTNQAVIVQSGEAGFEGVRSAAREMSAQAAAPIIEVTIGRIEVRAVTPPAPTPQPTRQRQAPPKMSLDDYLRAHSGGRT